MFKEHDMIALTEHIPLASLFDADADALSDSGNPHAGLVPGDIGTIVHIYPRGVAFIVEFLTSDGDMVAIADVTPSQARRATKADVADARFRKARRRPASISKKASAQPKGKIKVGVRRGDVRSDGHSHRSNRNKSSRSAMPMRGRTRIRA